MLKRGIVVVFLVVFLLNFGSALNEGYCATAEIVSINPSSVGADEDFTVGVLIDNCGAELPDNMIFEITRHSEDIEIKEPLVTSISKMGYSNSERFILYHMRSSLDASPGEHLFETKLSYGKGDFFMEENDNFSITVINEEPDLMISRVYTNPEIVYEGEKLILTIDVENAGNGEAKDVRVEIEDFALNGIKQKYLGRIESNENLPARFIFETNKDGIFEGNIKIDYKFGGEVRELNFPLQIQIFSKTTNNFWIIAIVLILGFLGYFLFGGEKTKFKS